jgi:hypothetical protein
VAARRREKGFQKSRVQRWIAAETKLVGADTDEKISRWIGRSISGGCPEKRKAFIHF